MNHELRQAAAHDVLIVHQHPLMRRALANTLAADSSFRIVGLTGFASLGIALAKHHPPDVIIVEATNIAAKNVESIAELKHSAPDAVILALLPDDDLFSAGALRAVGVTSFIDSYALPEEILAAVRANCGAATSTQRLADHSLSSNTQIELDPADIEILELLADGATDAEIGRQLFICARTVQSQLVRLRHETGCNNRAQLISWFARHAPASSD